MSGDDSDLHAYVDGELPFWRRSALLDRLTDDPEAAARVAEWRDQKRALALLFRTERGERPDPGWRQRSLALARVVRARGRRRTRARVVMAGGCVVGGLFLFLAYGADGPPNGKPAITAGPVRPQGSFGEAATPPDLSRLGWVVAGRRTAAGPLGPEMEYIYRASEQGAMPADAASSPPDVSLYVRRPDPSAPVTFGFWRRDDRLVFSWSDGRLSFVLVGDVETRSMLGLAKAVHGALASSKPSAASREGRARPVAERAM